MAISRLSLTPTASDAMVSCPAVHGAETTVAELRTFFVDEHVHMALLVDDARLIGAVERDDLARELPDALPAWAVAPLEGRTIAADTPAGDAFAAMGRAGRRRLAVVDPAGRLVGLLCLKASGEGFCSDADVASRRRGARRRGISTRGGRAGVAPIHRL